MSLLPKPGRFRHSFRIRIFLAMVLIILLVIPGTGYLCFRQAARVIEHQMQAFAVGAADQITKRVESFLSQHTFNVRLIKALFETGLIDMGDDREILRHFSLFQKDHPEFFNIIFGDETGRFLMAPAQIPEVHQTFDPRIRPWYQGALSSLDIHWTEVYLFASTQRPGMTVSVPIYDAAKRLQAVCGIDIDISSFSRFLSGIRIGNQGVAYIFDRKTGRIIAHPALVRQPWQPFQTDLLRQVHQDLTSRKSRSGITVHDGHRYVTAYTDYPGNSWTVGVTLPVSDLFENVTTVRRAIITLVLGGILLASLFSYLIAMTMVRPLTRLKQGIDRISSGDLGYKVEIEDPDIAAALARSFNQMAGSLAQSRKELERTCAELAQKDKLAAVGQMTAGIAHEIKNPLGIIQGAAQVVSNPDRPIEMREKAARFIMAEVDRLNNTLTAFLDFAKPPSPVLKPMDLCILVEELLFTLASQYPDHGFSLAADSPTVPVLADPDQIRQVMLNLLVNSIQSMPEGGPIKVSIRIPEQAGSPQKPIPVQKTGPALVRIEDTGCGIPEERCKRIFDPFVSFRDQGVGLGLSIVSQIMKAHGGGVGIQSVPGRGTCVTLTFGPAPLP